MRIILEEVEAGSAMIFIEGLIEVASRYDVNAFWRKG